MTRKITIPDHIDYVTFHEGCERGQEGHDVRSRAELECCGDCAEAAANLGYAITGDEDPAAAKRRSSRKAKTEITGDEDPAAGDQGGEQTAEGEASTTE
ncbi:MAG: hypothetical protein ACYDAY_11445 [Candidatus Dormibacteria bacterium]